MDFSYLLTDRRKICTQVWCGVKPSLIIWRWEPEISPTPSISSGNLRNYWIDLRKIFRIGSGLGADFIKRFIHFANAQGTFPRKPILWLNLRNWPTPSSSVALAFRKRLEYRNTDGRDDTDNHLSASCENLVGFGPAAEEFTRL